MKFLLKIEEIAFFIVALVLFSYEDYSWLVFVLFFMAPDASMIGYVINNRFGAFLYNIIHNRALPVALYCFGYYNSDPLIRTIAIIIFAHIAMDRVFGYGFKHRDRFDITHLD